MRKILKLNKLNVISFLISLYFAFSSTYIIDIDGKLNILIMILFLTIIFYGIFRLILKKIQIFNFNTATSNISKKEILRYLLTILLFLLFYYIALYPGGSSADAMDQYGQAISNSYKDWHPVIHTFLFYRLPTFFWDSYDSVIIWQLLIITGILTVLCYLIRKLGFNKKIVYLFLLLILLNPLNARMFTMPWKDIAYSLMLLLSTVLLIFIVKTNGKWLSKKKNILFLGVLMFLILGFRHNGLISFIFIIFALILLFQKYWKSISIMAILVFVSFCVITGPIFKLCNVEPHDSFAEVLGVPLNQISYIYNNYGEFTEEDKETFSKFANLPLWENLYNERDFNPIKWTEGAMDIDYINSHKLKFMKLYISLVKNNFSLALSSYYHLTSSIWSIETNTQGTYYSYDRHETENKNIYKISDDFNYLLTKYENWTDNIGIGKLFGYGGSLFLIMLSIAIIGVKSKFYLKKYLPFIPTLSNTLGIMLLITGGELRFVYSNILCAVPLLIYALSDISTKKETAKDKTLLNVLFLEKTNKTWLQFFRYIFVGGIAAVVNILTLFVLTDIFKIYYIISSILGFILGLIVNYLLSKLLVFTKESFNNKKKEFISYAIIGVIGLGIDTLFMYLFTSLFEVYYLLSKIISTIITFIWNFGARKIMYVLEGRKK